MPSPAIPSDIPSGPDSSPDSGPDSGMDVGADGPGPGSGSESPAPGPHPARVLRPWGWFETLAEGSGYRVKRLLLEPGQRLSLQRHRHRCEHWVVVGGEGELELDGARIPALPGTGLFIPEGAVHRAHAGHRALEIVEVQRGSSLRENDIERLADDYGRCA